VIGDVLRVHDIDPDLVFAAVDTGEPLTEYEKVHDSLVDTHRAFGVPTFIIGDRAVFVRLMTRPEGDGDLARSTIDRVLDLLEGAPEINEYKYTKINR
jgi:hypothetical protein